MLLDLAWLVTTRDSTYVPRIITSQFADTRQRRDIQRDTNMYAVRKGGRRTALVWYRLTSSGPTHQRAIDRMVQPARPLPRACSAKPTKEMSCAHHHNGGTAAAGAHGAPHCVVAMVRLPSASWGPSTWTPRCQPKSMSHAKAWH